MVDETTRILRVASMISEVDGCWMYSGPRQIRRPHQEKKQATPHRWFYELFRCEDGEVPDVLDPRCENGWTKTEDGLLPKTVCVNPDHYQPMTWHEYSSRIWVRFRETRKRCKHGHDLAEVGTDHRGVCRQCIKDITHRSYLRRKAKREAEREKEES